MKQKTSHGQILTSSSIIGGAAIIVMLLGMVRTKFAAILLGAGGLGVIAGFTAIQGIIGTVAGLGIQTSAVREIAAATGKGDGETVARVVLSMRRLCLLTGLLGMLAMMAFSQILSRLTFGSDAYTLDIAAFGIVILLVNLAAGQMALLQGMRRIGDMARANIIGAALAAFSAIGLYYWLGVRGITPSLISIAAIQMFISWYFANRIPLSPVTLTWTQTFSEASVMVKLGLVVMWTALMVGGINYLTVILITHKLDLNAVGLYSAAFTLSGISVNFVLGAMAADYYPRLVGVALNNSEVNRLVNEQTEVGLMLALPGLIATMSLAPWMLQIFYSDEFISASGLLQWFVLGCIGRIISFPLGHAILALGKARWYLLTETVTNFMHLALVAIALKWFGIDGVAIAFFVMNLVYIVVVFLVVRHLTGFSWSADCSRTSFYMLTASTITFITCKIILVWPATLIGMVIALTLGIFSLRELSRLVGSDHRIIQAISELPTAKIFLKRE